MIMVELAVGEWVNTAEGAELTGLSVDYVRRLARAGRIEARKVGRDWLIERASLLAFKATMDALGSDKHNPWRDDLPGDGGRK
jgi:excisionase family DNA binding protein